MVTMIFRLSRRSRYFSIIWFQRARSARPTRIRGRKDDDPDVLGDSIRLEIHLEEIDRSRASRRFRSANQFASTGERVDHRGFSDVGASDEGNLGNGVVRV